MEGRSTSLASALAAADLAGFSSTVSSYFEQQVQKKAYDPNLLCFLITDPETLTNIARDQFKMKPGQVARLVRIHRQHRAEAGFDVGTKQEVDAAKVTLIESMYPFATFLNSLDHKKDAPKILDFSRDILKSSIGSIEGTFNAFDTNKDKILDQEEFAKCLGNILTDSNKWLVRYVEYMCKDVPPGMPQDEKMWLEEVHDWLKENYEKNLYPALMRLLQGPHSAQFFKDAYERADMNVDGKIDLREFSSCVMLEIFSIIDQHVLKPTIALLREATQKTDPEKLVPVRINSGFHQDIKRDRVQQPTRGWQQQQLLLPKEVVQSPAALQSFVDQERIKQSIPSTLNQIPMPGPEPPQERFDPMAIRMAMIHPIDKASKGNTGPASLTDISEIRKPYSHGREYSSEGYRMTADGKRSISNSNDWSQMPEKKLKLSQDQYVNASLVDQPIETTELNKESLDTLHKLWFTQAKGEHASVASFANHAMELMKYGAPAYLLSGVLLAAEDEVRHAQACFALASRFHPEGHQFEPGSFPVASAGAISESMEEMVMKLTNEGCWGEVLGTLLAARQLRSAKDPQVAEVVRTIVHEEANHGVLAWNSVAWAIETGGHSILTNWKGEMERRLAMLAHFSDTVPDNAQASPAIQLKLLEGYGLISTEEVHGLQHHLGPVVMGSLMAHLLEHCSKGSKGELKIEGLNFRAIIARHVNELAESDIL